MKHGFVIIHQKEMQWKHVSPTKPQEIQGDYSLTLLNVNLHCLHLNNNDVTA